MERTINAGAAQVWALLSDAQRYPSWNPTVVSLRGRIADGERIELVSTANPKRTFKLKVSGVEPERRMVWQGGMPFGLFRGVRTFSLRPLSDSETVFSIREDYSGALAWLITRTIPDMTDAFAKFADCLRAAAEGNGG
ncbi:MAG: SRPBCC domain-containing protein [Solirubrobacterales bacterium]|nr:SRPBCC domain-containing protein [Solirubrobacterales bacterium]